MHCELDTRAYPKGIKVTDAEMAALNIESNKFHPEWNYAIPLELHLAAVIVGRRLTCKPASDQTITEYLHGAELREHRQTICKQGKHITTVYRWLAAVPLRATADAIAANWFSIEIFNDKGNRTYHNSFVTALAVSADPVAELAAGGRARWKIENDTFDVLKTGRYNLEHSFVHGKETLANVLVALNLLAFAFHTAAYLAVLAWRGAVIARLPKLPLLRASANHHH